MEITKKNQDLINLNDLISIQSQNNKSGQKDKSIQEVQENQNDFLKISSIQQQEKSRDFNLGQSNEKNLKEVIKQNNFQGNIQFQKNEDLDNSSLKILGQNDELIEQDLVHFQGQFLKQDQQSINQKKSEKKKGDFQTINLVSIHQQKEIFSDKSFLANDLNLRHLGDQSEEILEQEQENCKNLALNSIIVMFLISLVVILISFVQLVIQKNGRIQICHYEVIDFNKTGLQINILAESTKCDQFYGDVTNPVSQFLNNSMFYLTETSFSIQIQNLNSTEFGIPKNHEALKTKHSELREQYAKNVSQLKNEYEIIFNLKPFDFAVVRRNLKQEQLAFFSSLDFVYSKKLKAINLTLPSSTTFGLGERNGDFYLQDGTYTIWNKANSGVLGTGLGGQNLNGYFPVYLNRENSGCYNVMYLHSSSPLSVQKKGVSLSYRIKSGKIEMVWFLGKDPQSSIRQFHNFLGPFKMPFFWTLGNHLYFQQITTLDALNFTLQKVRKNFPIDVLTLDQSYLDDNDAFSFDKNKLDPAKMAILVNNSKIILQVDPGIKIDQSSSAYIEGINRNIFIHNPQQLILQGTNSLQQGVHYPDLFNPQINDYFNQMFNMLYHQIKFEGLFFSENEITDYSNNSPTSETQTDSNQIQQTHQKHINYFKDQKLQQEHYNLHQSNDPQNQNQKIKSLQTKKKQIYSEYKKTYSKQENFDQFSPQQDEQINNKSQENQKIKLNSKQKNNQITKHSNKNEKNDLNQNNDPINKLIKKSLNYENFNQIEDQKNDKIKINQKSKQEHFQNKQNNKKQKYNLIVSNESNQVNQSYLELDQINKKFNNQFKKKDFSLKQREKKIQLSNSSEIDNQFGFLNQIKNKFDLLQFNDAVQNETQNHSQSYQIEGEPFEKGTISLDSVHVGGYQELDTHPLFGIQQSQLAEEYLSRWAQKHLSFIVSKSTFPGFGRFGAHLVDLKICDWKSLKISLQQLFHFQFYGVPIVGFSFCDQAASNDITLYSRLIQLSTFFPFFSLPVKVSIQKKFVNKKNYFHQETSSSSYLNFLDDPYQIKLLQTSQQLRYTFSRYIFQEYVKTGGVGQVIRPLFYDFPQDEVLLNNMIQNMNQFMVGEGLMVTPLLEKDKILITPYFPREQWFDYYSGLQIRNELDPGSTVQIYVDIDQNIPIFIRGGRILPLLQVQSGISLYEQKGSIELLIALQLQPDGEMGAQGNLMALKNYESSNIHQMCILQNCLIDVKAKAITVVQRPPLVSYYQVQIHFKSQIPGINVEEINIERLVFYSMIQTKRIIWTPEPPQLYLTLNQSQQSFTINVTP